MEKDIFNWCFRRFLRVMIVVVGITTIFLILFSAKN